MSSLASRRSRDGVPDEEKLVKDLRKLDISSSENPIVENEIIFVDDSLDGYGKDQEIGGLSLGADTSRRQGAETAPAYGLLSDEESSLKR